MTSPDDTRPTLTLLKELKVTLITVLRQKLPTVRTVSERRLIARTVELYDKEQRHEPLTSAEDRWLRRLAEYDDDDEEGGP